MKITEADKPAYYRVNVCDIPIGECFVDEDPKLWMVMSRTDQTGSGMGKIQCVRFDPLVVCEFNLGTEVAPVTAEITWSRKV